jgi:hypothetical protein
VASLHAVLGNVAYRQGNLETAREHLQRALVNVREANRRDGIADAQLHLAWIERDANELDMVRHRLSEALEEYQRLDIQPRVREVERFLSELEVQMSQEEDII